MISSSGWRGNAVRSRHEPASASRHDTVRPSHAGIRFWPRGNGSFCGILCLDHPQPKYAASLCSCRGGFLCLVQRWRSEIDRRRQAAARRRMGRAADARACRPHCGEAPPVRLAGEQSQRRKRCRLLAISNGRRIARSLPATNSIDNYLMDSVIAPIYAVL